MENRRRQEVAFPRWVEDIGISYRVLGSLKADLGRNRQRITDSCDQKAVHAFCQALPEIKNFIPEFVPLWKGSPQNVPSEDTSLPGFKSLGKETFVTYYLKDQEKEGNGKIYVIYQAKMPPFTLHNSPALYPESADFVGFDELINSDANPIITFHKISNLQTTRFFGLEEAETILNYSKRLAKDQGTTTASFAEIKEKLANLKAKAAKDIDLLEEPACQQIKVRTLNLARMVIGHSLPTFDQLAKSFLADRYFIDAGNSQIDGYRKVFLPDQDVLVIAPIKEVRFFWGKIQVPDRTRMQKAPSREWLDTNILVKNLMARLPDNVRKTIYKYFSLPQ